MDVINVLHRGGSEGSFLRVVDVGFFPTYWEDFGRFSPSGDTVTDGLYATVERVWYMDVPSPVGLNGG